MHAELQCLCRHVRQQCADTQQVTGTEDRTANPHLSGQEVLHEPGGDREAREPEEQEQPCGIDRHLAGIQRYIVGARVHQPFPLRGAPRDAFLFGTPL